MRLQHQRVRRARPIYLWHHGPRSIPYSPLLEPRYFGLPAIPSLEREPTSRVPGGGLQPVQHPDLWATWQRPKCPVVFWQGHICSQCCSTVTIWREDHILKVNARLITATSPALCSKTAAGEVFLCVKLPDENPRRLRYLPTLLRQRPSDRAIW